MKFRPLKRKEKTDYKKRLSLLKSKKPRLVVRVTSRNIVAQLINYHADGDVTVVGTSTKELQKLGWKAARCNIPGAYLVGYLLAKKAKGKITEAVLDIGKQSSVKKSRIYAAVKGAIDGGLPIPADESMFPSDDRLSGEHTKTYAAHLAETNKERYTAYFSGYLAQKMKPEDLPQHVVEIKGKIEGL